MSECDFLRGQYVAPGTGDPADIAWVEHLKACADCRVAVSGLPLADRALSLVGSMPVAVPDFSAVASAAASAARNQRRRRTVRRGAPFLYTGLAAAALAAGFVTALLIGRARHLAPSLLLPGSELQATAEAKSAVLSNGVRIRLDEGTLKVAQTTGETHSLVLPSGRVFVEVPKLTKGATLSLRTPDAEVRVHGTRFQVVRTRNDTQIHVVEGLVEVRPEGLGRKLRTLGAGESITVASAESYREELRRSTLAALDRGVFPAAEKQIVELLGSGAQAAERAEAQALLAWSLSARGKRGEAIDRYRQAMLLLPDGQRPLWAENACAELALLEEQERPQDSARAWAECLRRFPDGVHAGLARARLGTPR